MYGLEKDDSKENEVSCVWVGSTTNYASKYSDIANGGEIFISGNVYEKLPPDLKQNGIWTISAKYKGEKLYEGYIANCFYLDFYTELGDVVKTADDNSVNYDTSKKLAEGIKVIDELINKLTQREKEIAVLEQKLILENQQLANKYLQLTADYDDIKNKQEVTYSNYKALTYEYFNFIKDFLQKLYFHDDCVNDLGKDIIMDAISKMYKIGASLGYNKEFITSLMDCYLIYIYSYFGLNYLAYEAMTIMARRNSTWVWIKEDVVKWASLNYISFQVYDAIKERLDNYEIYDAGKRKTFSSYLEDIRRIRGF